jgi:16S rRNA (cytidine1402-2'-O)-methyltransferase
MVYLVPNVIADTPPGEVIPEGGLQVIRTLRHFVAEDIRTVRRFLARVGMPVPLDELQFYVLNEHTTEAELAGLARPMQLYDIGMVSEAGAPGVADPGSDLVRMAHAQGIPVRPLTGPSSLLLALMASGMNGQHFAFHGYLPVKRAERMEAIRRLEHRALSEGSTQIFIEAPYRNDALLEDILSVCRPATRVCVAAGISSSSEYIRTLPVAEWKCARPKLHKIPVVFLLGV